jgi:DNA replication protein DnaC
MSPDEQRAQRDALARIHAIPPKLADDLAATVRPTDALRFALAWLESGADILVLQGGTGSGKSLAAAWAFEFAQNRAPMNGMGDRRSPLWFDAGVLASLSQYAERVWSAFDNASVIVIDDAGIEPNAERVGAAIERAVNVSTARMLITTNLDPGDFRQRYGERIASRMRGRGKWIRVASPDYRGNAAKLPEGEWPSPRAQTDAERVIAARTEAERAREEAEFIATAEVRAELAAKAMAKIDALAAGRRSPYADAWTDEQDETDHVHADDEARARLQKQLEDRRGLVPVADVFLDIEREEQEA